MGKMVKNGGGLTGFRPIDLWEIEFLCEASMEEGTFVREKRKCREDEETDVCREKWLPFNPFRQDSQHRSTLINGSQPT